MSLHKITCGICCWLSQKEKVIEKDDSTVPLRSPMYVNNQVVYYGSKESDF